MLRRIFVATVIFMSMLCFTISGEAVIHTKNDNWLVYMYICGTDLEEGANATKDIIEMQKVALPQNVKVLIYANGAITWKHNFIEKKDPAFIYMIRADYQNFQVGTRTWVNLTR